MCIYITDTLTGVLNEKFQNSVFVLPAIDIYYAGKIFYTRTFYARLSVVIKSKQFNSVEFQMHAEVKPRPPLSSYTKSHPLKQI